MVFAIEEYKKGLKEKRGHFFFFWEEKKKEDTKQ